MLTQVKPINSSNRRSQSTLGADVGDLVLRIRGTHRHGQVVRVASKKCTIGSGDSATLRILAKGVKPLHCVIVRGMGETVVRRWSPDTRLNGSPFNDAQLHVGDRLGIGPIEFEVVDLAAGPSSARKLTSPNPALLKSVRSLQDQLVAQDSRLSETLKRAESKSNTLEAQLLTREQEISELAESLADANATLQQERNRAKEQHAELEASLAAALSEVDDDTVRIAQLQADLDEQRWLLETQRDSLKKDRDDLQFRFDDLAKQKSELELRYSELAEAQSKAEAEVARLHEELDERETQINARLEATEAERHNHAETLDQRRLELNQLEEDLQTRLDNFEQETSEQAAKLAAQQEKYEDSIQKLEAREAEVAQRESALKIAEADLAQREAELQVRIDEIATRERELESERVRLAGLGASLDEQQAQWKQEHAAAVAEFEAARASVEQADQASDEAQGQLAELQRQLELEADRLAASEAERQRFEAEVEELQLALRNQAEISASEAEVQAMREELTSRQAELEALATELQTRQEEFETAKSQWETDQQAYAEQAQDDELLANVIQGSDEDHERKTGEAAESNPDEFVPSESDEADSGEAAMARLKAQGLWGDQEDLHDDRQSYLGGSDLPSNDYGEQPGNSYDDYPLDGADESYAFSPDYAAAADGAGPTGYDSEPEADDSYSAFAESTDLESHETPSTASLAADDEVSIEDYMAQLLQRMGGSASSASPAPQPETQLTTADRKATAPADADATATTTEAVAEPPQEFRPRSTAPERQSNLAAMRELANDSARSAIQTSVRSASSRAATGKLLLALLAMGFGIALLAVTSKLISTSALGAVACFSAAAYLFYEGLKLRRSHRASLLESERTAKPPIVEPKS